MMSDPSIDDRDEEINRVARSFDDWFEAARRGELELAESQIEPARELQFIFVSGFHNEMMPYYFQGNIKELRRLGISPKNIHRLHPSSHATSEKVIDWVASSVERLADRNPGRLVIVGHSRGACLALAAALRQSDWSRDRLEAMFLIQGPFGGTGIADYVILRRSTFPANWPLARARLARTLTAIERFALWVGWDSGLLDLTHEAARRFWRDEIEDFRAGWGEQALELEKKTYFITSCIEPDRSRFPRSELGRILEECDGPNDGVVAFIDQSLEGFGTRLGPLEAAHTDLVWGLYSTPAAKLDRRALARALIRVLADRRAVDADLPP